LLSYARFSGEWGLVDRAELKDTGVEHIQRLFRKRKIVLESWISAFEVKVVNFINFLLGIFIFQYIHFELD